MEVLAHDRAEWMQRFNDGARRILLDHSCELEQRLVRMAAGVIEIYSADTRGRHLITWLAHTTWGGQAARAALRQSRLVDLEASLEALKTLESGEQMSFGRGDPYVSAEEFVLLISTLTHGLMVDRLIDIMDEDQAPPDLIGRVATALVPWVLCRDENAPTVHDLRAYLGTGRYGMADRGDTADMRPERRGLRPLPDRRAGRSG